YVSKTENKSRAVRRGQEAFIEVAAILSPTPHRCSATFCCPGDDTTGKRRSSVHAHRDTSLGSPVPSCPLSNRANAERSLLNSPGIGESTNKKRISVVLRQDYESSLSLPSSIVYLRGKRAPHHESSRPVRSHLQTTFSYP
ncbi:unnamed protein product, partial [Ectocarpus sp. 12 AP-2014]